MKHFLTLKSVDSKHMNTMPQKTDIPFKNIQEGSSTTEYVDGLIAFLEKYLPYFTIETRANKSQNENDLSEELYKHLTRKARINADNIAYPFEFQPEKSQKKPKQKGHAKRIDIATRLNTVDINMEVIYCIEAKKLPTDKLDGAREKEYVDGKGGAIARFKREDHGMDDEGNLLTRNGIVAYVTEHDFQHWHTLINTWITDKSRFSKELLKKEYFGKIGKLTSFHPRISGNDVEINHFWVNV
jgi:hypothetical protein